jgi:hypothetical protein
LVTDINLGEGPDGWDVARQARELIPNLPTGYVSGAIEHEWASHGAAQRFSCEALRVGSDRYSHIHVAKRCR